MIKHNTITFRLSIIFIFLIVSLSIFLISYNFIKSSENSYKYLNTISTKIIKNIEDRTLSQLNKTNTHIRLLTNINNNKNILLNKEKNYEVMSEFLKSEKHLASIYIADNYGNFYQTRRDPEFALREIDNYNNLKKEYWEYKDENFNTISKKSYTGDYDPRVRFWYKEAKRNTISISNPYIYASTKKLGITIYYPKFKKNEKILVSGIDITLDSLTEFLINESKKSSSNITLIDNNNRIISSSLKHEKLFDITGSKQNTKFKSIYNYITGNKTGLIKNSNNETIYYIGKTFPIDDEKKWHIVLEIPEEKILKNAKDIMYHTLVISFFILTIFILIAIIISRQITKPIVELSHNMDELHKLNLNIDVKADSKIKEIYDAQDSLKALTSAIRSFTKYMPYDLVKILIKEDEEAHIGGEEKDIAIMFTDIHNFTKISENLSSKELIKELSKYFDLISKIIKENDGTIDKYIGDSVMAFWNAPLSIEEPVKKAVLTAIQIQKKLNKTQENHLFKTRIGIHYGRTLVGNIGSEKRMNYTIIGDSVNLASRIEEKNKDYDTSILISEDVYNLVKDEFEIKHVNMVKIKGKENPINLYEVIDLKKG